MPRMPLSGVRISWLTVARKRHLARLAPSASRSSQLRSRELLDALLEPRSRRRGCRLRRASSASAPQAARRQRARNRCRDECIEPRKRVSERAAEPSERAPASRPRRAPQSPMRAWRTARVRIVRAVLLEPSTPALIPGADLTWNFRFPCGFRGLRRSCRRRVDDRLTRLQSIRSTAAGDACRGGMWAAANSAAAASGASQRERT